VGSRTFSTIAKVQQLERSAATNRIAVLNLERLRDEKEQSFPDWQIPSDLLLESQGFFAETLDKLDKLSGNLWEKWVNTSPLVHDIGKTICSQKFYLPRAKNFAPCYRVFVGSYRQKTGRNKRFGMYVRRELYV
jgi:hypothetical protein